MNPNKNYIYKQLSSADVTFLKELLRVFGEAFGETHTYQSAVPGDDYLQSLLSKQHFIVLVAMYTSEIIGGLAAYELENNSNKTGEKSIFTTLLFWSIIAEKVG